VFAWGFNEKGQLGLGHRFNQEQPQLVTALQGAHIVKLACGEQHSLALSDAGQVWTWVRERVRSAAAATGHCCSE